MFSQSFHAPTNVRKITVFAKALRRLDLAIRGPLPTRVLVDQKVLRRLDLAIRGPLPTRVLVDQRVLHRLDLAIRGPLPTRVLVDQKVLCAHSTFFARWLCPATNRRRSFCGGMRRMLRALRASTDRARGNTFNLSELTPSEIAHGATPSTRAS